MKRGLVRALVLAAVVAVPGLAFYSLDSPVAPPAAAPRSHVRSTRGTERATPARPGEAPVAPAQPRLTPGREVTVELSEPPAARYLAAVAGENDAFYARLVAEVSRGRAVHDPDLGRAAREFIFQFTEFGDEPPSDVRDFLLSGSGAVAGDTVFQHLRTTSDDETALRTAIQTVVAEPPTGTGALHVGVGEIFTPGGEFSRHIGVIGTRLPIALEPMERRAAPGTIWHLRGRLRASYTGLEALVMGPGGSIARLAPEVDGDRLSVAVAVGRQPGPLDVQLVGQGPDGPGKLVQVRVEIGRPLPHRYTTRLAADEAGLATADEAAHYAFELINADRARHRLAALTWDERLASTARDHSADMRDQGYFGHLSPTTGLHTDRLAAVRYRAVASSENLAHNASIAEAEAGLMESLGHRRNLLDPQVTHVGVGVAGEEGENRQRRWWVTQLFARPVEDLDLATATAALRDRIAHVRAEKGLSDLKSDPGLDAVAEQAARSALGGGLDSVSSAALEQARERGLLRGRLRAWAALVPELGTVELPETIRAAAARKLGIGIFQDAASLDGRIAVALLVGD